MSTANWPTPLKDRLLSRQLPQRQVRRRLQKSGRFAAAMPAMTKLSIDVTMRPAASLDPGCGVRAPCWVKQWPSGRRFCCTPKEGPRNDRQTPWSNRCGRWRRGDAAPGQCPTRSETTRSPSRDTIQARLSGFAASTRAAKQARDGWMPRRQTAPVPATPALPRRSRRGSAIHRAAASRFMADETPITARSRRRARGTSRSPAPREVAGSRTASRRDRYP